ncbi:hypothetical protein P152DRAFT_337503 [Eremomyces bilateralis CBS 781.70]|uniref:Uncharacterized protein n=1 Tax=Eremomyces bilateralis CBS 781.70 TaxID=1392243 RepID=A0A6G1G5G3_9PEZI|nr:uncharacterized protein P152DRAFT_337503 [Eremomyces bilateralis CBS 781.70]KAF1813069.1 hypothetical protein P152DRAFT_337503 [Eremomyces bilateralis CBS 781.70]
MRIQSMRIWMFWVAGSSRKLPNRVGCPFPWRLVSLAFFPVFSLRQMTRRVWQFGDFVQSHGDFTISVHHHIFTHQLICIDTSMEYCPCCRYYYMDDTYCS